MILEALQLQKLIPVFEKHRISYLNFLRLRDRDFIEIGITDQAERRALVQTIRETSRSVFTDTVKPLRIRRKLT